MQTRVYSLMWASMLPLATLAFADLANAQSSDLTKFAELPPGKPDYDENGVDVMAGGYTFPQTDVSIGPDGKGGLAYTRFTFNALARRFFSLDGATRSIFDSDVTTTYELPDGPGDGYIVTATFGTSSDKFTNVPYTGSSVSSANPVSGNGATYETAGSIYTRHDGTKVYYSTSVGSVYQSTDQDNRVYYSSRYAADKVEFPDGETWTMYYKSINMYGAEKMYRYQSIVSNRGYQLKFVYALNSVTRTSPLSSLLQWKNPSRIIAINNAFEYCDPNADSCPLSTQWPDVTYAYTRTSNSDARTVSQPTSRVTRYVSNGDLSIKLPNSSVDNINYYMKQAISPYYPGQPTDTIQVDRVVKDGKTWQHSYTLAGDGISGTHVIKDPSLATWTYNFTWGTSSVPIGSGDEYAEPFYRTPNTLNSFRDPLNAVTSFTYDSFYRIKTVTRSEGNSWESFYDNRGNVTQIVRRAKPGSGLPDTTVQTQTFPVSCANPKSCNNPLSVTDANGNTMAYTYDAAHGGVLTETGPLVNGIAPQKRYEYAQRYAWVKNSGGAYVQASSPIWVRTRERYCRTTAAAGASCSGGAADEVVTDYDYGSNVGPNNLLLRGIAVTADGQTLRTCYGYDQFGHKISEATPSANLTVCS